jgi:replicative DNA helicase
MTRAPSIEDQERELLGDLLAGGPVDAVIEVLRPDDFGRPDHRRIFEVIRSLQGQGIPTDPISVRAELGVQNGDGPDLGLVLGDLAATAALPTAAPHHARLLRESASRRRSIEVLESAAQRLRNGDDPAEVLGNLEATHAALVQQRSRVVDGAAWILDAERSAAAVWGRGSEILWASGETTLLTGPDGSGKTRLARQVIGARLGFYPEVLGMPVAKAPGKVLLLATDRPAQIRRLFTQAFGEDERQDLADRLLVHPGPLEFDIVKDTSALARWVSSLGASDLVIDSLGSLVGGLTKDEVGSNLAISLSRVAAEGTEVLTLFHPRKATQDNREPRELPDVYGSRWLTAAAGSVISLWGRPGDPIVRLRHLKQPMAEVGPFDVTFDPIAGYATVASGTDLPSLLRSARQGLTARAAATALYSSADPTRAEVERARRALERLVPTRAYRRDGAQPTEPATYFSVPPARVQEPLE